MWSLPHPSPTGARIPPAPVHPSAALHACVSPEAASHKAPATVLASGQLCTTQNHKHLPTHFRAVSANDQ